MTATGARVEDRGELLERARRTIVAVGKAATGKEGKVPIQTDAATLLAIAELMATMLEDMNACGGTQCMGRAVNGIRTWVTQDRFDAVQARSIRLEQALRRIAKEGDVAQEYEMLVDWRETATTLRHLARSALNDA